jgi:hypothetical protein
MVKIEEEYIIESGREVFEDIKDTISKVLFDDEDY